MSSLKISARVSAAVLATLCASLSTGGCSRDRIDEAPAAAAPATADQLLSDIERAFAQMNFGEAASLSSAGQQSYPGDARLHLAAAKAHARLGDADASANAFERARATGLTEPAKALADPAFDSVRHHRAFGRFTSKIPPTSAPVAVSGPDSHIRAGDVEIIESPDGDYIRAGDVVLDTRE